MTIRKKMTQDEVRSRVNIDGNGCWIWTGSMANSRGRLYPILGSTSARKMAFEAFVGPWFPLEEAALVGMSCGNQKCINPDHVRVGADNSFSAAGARSKREKAFCVHGHEYAVTGIYRNKAGAKVCMECVRLRGKRMTEKKLADKNKPGWRNEISLKNEIFRNAPTTAFMEGARHAIKIMRERGLITEQGLAIIIRDFGK